MYKFRFIFLFLVLFYPSYALSEVISGNVRQDEILEKYNTIIDSNTEKPIEGAKVSIPKYNLYTKTDSNGRFQLNTNFEDKAILQVEKSGYTPFSITVDKTINKKPLRLGIQKTTADNIFVDTGVFHLGDAVFSDNSADSTKFRLKPIGPFYSKMIKIPKSMSDKQVAIVFGSVIGLDTKMAKEMGQNKIISVYSSPTEIFFNGQKIGELNINGDNQKVLVPPSLIKPTNELVVKTGKNLFQYNYIDYDDIEIANIRIEAVNRTFADVSN